MRKPEPSQVYLRIALVEFLMQDSLHLGTYRTNSCIVLHSTVCACVRVFFVLFFFFLVCLCLAGAPSYL